MAVTIQLDVDAAGATGSIGQVALALQGLERVADDIDIDFDADIGDITDEIEAFSDALEGINLDMESLGDDVRKAAKELDGAEVSVVADTPDGSTNKGDSTGADPPDGLVHKLNQFGDEIDTGAVSATDGGERANLFERTYGPDATLMSESDVGDIFKMRNSRESNLGEHASSFPGIPHEMMQVGTRTGFGLDPESMNLRRMADDISMEGFQKAANPNHGLSTPERRFRERISGSDLITETVEELGQQQRNLLEGSGLDADRVSQRHGFNFSQLTEDLQDELMDQAGIRPSNRFDRFGERKQSLSQFTEEQREKLRGPAEEMFKGEDLTEGRSRKTFRDLNEDIRDAVPETDAEIDASSRSRRGMPDFDQIKTPKEILADTNFGKRASNINSVSDAFEGLGKAQSSLGKKLRRLKPTMGKYMQLLAALIPIAVALGTQLLGVAAAMGSVAVAGGAIMGLGLLGHGESMSESFAQAKQELRDLKSEMFNAAQPLAQQFAPMQSRMFDAIPEGMGGIFEEMEGLKQFEDTLFELGSALAGGIEEFFAIINRNSDAISDLVTTFGGLIGSGLLNFFEFLIQSASENKQLIKDLGGALISLAVVAFNVSMAISRVVAALKPAFDAVAALSGLLNNPLIIGMLTALTVATLLTVGFTKVTLAVWGMVSAVQALIAFLSALGSGSLLAGIGVLFSELLIYIQAAIAHFGALKFAALSAAAAIAATGIGALAVGAGVAAGGAMISSSGPDTPGSGVGGGSGGRMGGSQTVYNDNRSFTINNGGGDDYASQKKMEDTVRQVNETNSAQELPPVETSSRESDSEDDN